MVEEKDRLMVNVEISNKFVWGEEGEELVKYIWSFKSLFS